KTWTFHHFDFNDSIIIRLKHTHYEYSESNKNGSEIEFNFMDVKGVSVLYAKLTPGTSRIIVVCTIGYYVGGRHHGSDHYRNYYEFVLIFAVYGIMIYHDEKFLKFSKFVLKTFKILSNSITV
ncbi:hypothetical protein WUBG_16372, partial [Wuchereria bancrofti]